MIKCIAALIIMVKNSSSFLRPSRASTQLSASVAGKIPPKGFRRGGPKRGGYIKRVTSKAPIEIFQSSTKQDGASESDKERALTNHKLEGTVFSEMKPESDTDNVSSINFKIKKTNKKNNGSNKLTDLEKVAFLSQNELGNASLHAADTINRMEDKMNSSLGRFADKMERLMAASLDRNEFSTIKEKEEQQQKKEEDTKNIQQEEQQSESWEHDGPLNIVHSSQILYQTSYSLSTLPDRAPSSTALIHGTDEDYGFDFFVMPEIAVSELRGATVIGASNGGKEVIAAADQITVLESRHKGDHALLTALSSPRDLTHYQKKTQSSQNVHDLNQETAPEPINSDFRASDHLHSVDAPVSMRHQQKRRQRLWQPTVQPPPSHVTLQPLGASTSDVVEAYSSDEVETSPSDVVEACPSDATSTNNPISSSFKNLPPKVSQDTLPSPSFSGRGHDADPRYRPLGTTNTTVFVKGLDSSIPEQEMRKGLSEVFGSCGTVIQVRIPVDSKGWPKGIALVVMADEASKERCAGLDNTLVLGRFIRLDMNPGAVRPRIENEIKREQEQKVAVAAIGRGRFLPPMPQMALETEDVNFRQFMGNSEVTVKSHAHVPFEGQVPNSSPRSNSSEKHQESNQETSTGLHDKEPLSSTVLQNKGPSTSVGLHNKEPLSSTVLHNKEPLSSTRLHNKGPSTFVGLHNKEPLSSTRLHNKGPSTSVGLHNKEPLSSPSAIDSIDRLSQERPHQDTLPSSLEVGSLGSEVERSVMSDNAREGQDRQPRGGYLRRSGKHSQGYRGVIKT